MTVSRRFNDGLTTKLVEAAAAPADVEPIEWVLYTSLPVQTPTGLIAVGCRSSATSTQSPLALIGGSLRAVSRQLRGDSQ